MNKDSLRQYLTYFGCHTYVIKSILIFYPLIKIVLSLRYNYLDFKQSFFLNNILARYPRILHTDDIKITFYASSRKKGNPTCDITSFLLQLLKQTVNIAAVEVLIAIDADDDVKYYNILAAKFSPFMNLKIIISEVNYGSSGLHLYDRELFKHISPKTKMLIDYSDDCVIIYKGWDDALLSIDSQIKDNIYFIHTNDMQLERYVGEINDNIPKIIWLQQIIAPSSYFPIISKRVLDIAQECLEELHDDRGQWSPIANARNCDCYIDVLSRIFQAGINEKRVFYIRMMMVSHRYVNNSSRSVIPLPVEMNICCPKSSINTNDINFLTLLDVKTIEHLRRIARKLILAVNG